MIIGVTGFYAAGKDTVADYLKTQGFIHISLSDFIRQEILKRKQKITRERLIETGNELRQKFGNGALAHKAVLAFEQFKNHVVTSIRHPEEVNTLRQRKDFILIFVDAPIEVRFNRYRSRSKADDKDSMTLDAFRQNEEREMHSDGSGQQLQRCKDMADIILRNDKDLTSLNAKLDKILAAYLEKFKYKRPSWDEYFVEISRTVAKRATCDRGMSGAVIAKDKQILTTGYVGAAAGLPQCDEVGHLFQDVINDKGVKSKHCVRTSHAEQNAIVQAAKIGVAIKGATMYCKMVPCPVCARMIINAGIVRVVAEKHYHGAGLTYDMFKLAGVKLDVLKDELEIYKGMK
jgi:dCMP deaminase